ncbi:MAG TPA: alpha/beta hydrolase [Candidatus Kurthia intestinigallinarum]|nr:alpha/beta hydrolase [Candidatus Kurthia intestinigallinarum]
MDAFTLHNYQITVTIPEKPHPKEGFPVLYVLDGAHNGPVVRAIIDAQMMMRKLTKISRMIVVTIEQPPAKRFFDFTPQAPHYNVSSTFPMPKEGPFGGAEVFQQFLVHDVKPFIAAHYPASSRSTLFGHSLSGFYVLWHLLTAPEDFTSYIALSPSVWWNDEELLTYSTALLEAHSPKNLYVAVGEFERSMHAPIERLLTHLSAVPHTFYIAPEENHLSVLPTVLSRALRFIK